MTTGFAFAVLAQEIDAELEVRPLHLAVDGLADVVKERRAHRDVRVEADFPGHDAGQPRHFGRVRQDVLPVAGAELQASHQPEDLGVEIVQAELEGDRAALLAHLLVGFVLDLLDDLFDARRMNAAVGDQLLDRLLRDLAPIRIEARQDDRAGVSSTIRSTPVASSSARMLRPSRPMMRPLRSSLGRSTTETVVSMACSAAER